MSGSFESVRWNACVHRLNFGLYSHPKEFLGNGVRIHNNKSMITQSEKFPLRRLRRGLNPQYCIVQDSGPNALSTELFLAQSVNQKLND